MHAQSATVTQRRSSLQAKYIPYVSSGTFERAPVWARGYISELELALIRAQDQIARLTEGQDGPVAVIAGPSELPVRYPEDTVVQFTGPNGSEFEVRLENEGRDNRAGRDRLHVVERTGRELLARGDAMNVCDVVAVDD